MICRLGRYFDRFRPPEKPGLLGWRWHMDYQTGRGWWEPPPLHEFYHPRPVSEQHRRNGISKQLCHTSKQRKRSAARRRQKCRVRRKRLEMMSKILFELFGKHPSKPEECVKSSFALAAALTGALAAGLAFIFAHVEYSEVAPACALVCEFFSRNALNYNFLSNAAFGFIAGAALRKKVATPLHWSILVNNCIVLSFGFLLLPAACATQETNTTNVQHHILRRSQSLQLLELD